MTGVLRKTSRNFRNAVGLREPSGKKREAANTEPAPPTTDIAAMNAADRIGRRRGVLATIFGGSVDNPSVQKRTLGG